MNILLLSDVYFPRINGVSRSIQVLRKELHAQGHSSLLVAPDYENRKSLFFDNADKILRIPATSLPLDPEDRLMSSRFLKKAYHYIQLHELTFDVIHIHTPFRAHSIGMKWASSFNIPVIETYHTYFEEYLHCYIPFVPKFILSAIARQITRSQCKNLARLVVPSSPIQQIIESYGINTPLSIIPTGLNNDDFFMGNGSAFKKNFNIEEQRPIIMYVGRIAFEKNIEFLLLVTRKLAVIHPDILLVIAGEGPALTRLVQRVSELQISRNVKFVGYLSRNRMLRNCYSASDVFVFASRTETQGLVLLEAMAQAIPVVSTAILGTRDVLKHGEGCLIADENPDDFTRKVSDLLKAPSRRRSLGQKGRAYACGFSSVHMAAHMVELYNDAINSNKNNCKAAFSLESSRS